MSISFIVTRYRFITRTQNLHPYILFVCIYIHSVEKSSIISRLSKGPMTLKTSSAPGLCRSQRRNILPMVVSIFVPRTRIRDAISERTFCWRHSPRVSMAQLMIWQRDTKERCLSGFSYGLQYCSCDCADDFFCHRRTLVHRRGTVVKVLCYKSEGCWFDPSWCHWIFHWDNPQRKNPQHAFLRRGSKAVGPMS